MAKQTRPNKAGQLLNEVRACTLCPELPFGPRPVLQVSPEAKILIAGQAPGRKVHETGIPFDDPSGDRLRAWMGIDRDVFYDASRIAILPMAFCYPGTGSSGDLPPPPRCAQIWRKALLDTLASVEFTIVIGTYARDWHVPAHARQPLTATIEAWESHWPELLLAPHPSPRNNRWLARNPWFAEDVLPRLQARVAAVLGS